MGLDNPLHIAFIVVILLLVFGARRLPEIGRSLGVGMREFKESVTGESKPALGPAQQVQAPQPPVQQPQPVAAPAPPPQQPAPEPVAAQPGPTGPPTSPVQTPEQ